jgi:hypothetical protein
MCLPQWTCPPKESNGEQGPQGGPTANRDPTATIQPRGTKPYESATIITEEIGRCKGILATPLRLRRREERESTGGQAASGTRHAFASESMASSGDITVGGPPGAWPGGRPTRPARASRPTSRRCRSGPRRTSRAPSPGSPEAPAAAAPTAGSHANNATSASRIVR